MQNLSIQQQVKRLNLIMRNENVESCPCNQKWIPFIKGSINGINVAEVCPSCNKEFHQELKSILKEAKSNNTHVLSFDEKETLIALLNRNQEDFDMIDDHFEEEFELVAA